MKVLIIVAVLVVVIQFVPVTKDNPVYDKSSEILTNSKVKEILKRACYDCHSFDTKYSVYSKIAPISWGVRRHISNGRKALNFSIWEQMSDDIKRQRVQKMFSEVKHGFMPLPTYVMFHKKARLSTQDKQILHEWVDKDLKPKYSP